MSTRTAPSRTAARPQPVRHPWLVGGTVGVLTAAVALGVAELVAGFVGEVASPIVAVGSAAIDASPPWLKDFAIRTFGSNDKVALIVGIAVVLAGLAAVSGVLALGRHWVGYVALIAFGLIGILAAVSRPTKDALSALPSVVGVVAGMGAYRLLLRAAGPSVAIPRGRSGAPAAGGRRRPTESAGGTAPGSGKVQAFDRRRFLLTGLALGGGAAVAGIGGRVVGNSASKAEASRAGLKIPAPSDVGAPAPSGADLRIPGLTSFYTPNASFYRVDTAIIVPKVSAQDWRLRVHGMVDREIEMNLDQLMARPLIERDITLTCVSNEVGGNYIGNARWIGAALGPILEEAGVHPGADQLVSRSADGFTVGTPTAALMDGRDAMLAVAMNGQPLPLAHGFPVRMVVPGLYGYVSATKWVVDMELTTFGAYDAYWVIRGWDQQAPIKTMSRIDTPRSRSLQAGRVPVAGIAWAQGRGISKVEVRIDGGPWNTATLAAQDTVDTWRQWLYPWDATSGRHVIQVRATDGTGQTQTGAVAPPPPNGATGWHTVVVNVA